MKSVFTFLWGSLLTGSVAAQIPQATRPLSDICRIRFKMDDRTSQTCNSGSTPTRNGSSITLLGKRIADGIYWERNPISAGSSEDQLWAKNGTTTPPAGSLFNDCPGNWVYFKASGFNYFSRADDSKELINIHIRVKAFGNERNPDSLRVEFARNTDVRPQKLFNSAKKDIICQDFECVLPDYSAPHITNCVQNEKVIFPLTPNVTTISSTDLMAFNHLNAIDDCSVADIRTYPYKLHNVKNGQLVDYHTIAYDSSGNQSTCRFKVQFLSPTNDTCSVRFRMETRNTPTCDGSNPVTTHGNHSISLLGKRIADGIQIYKSPMSAGGSTTVLFGKNGSKIPPTGSHFITCSGNWTYFTASGRSVSVRSHQNTEYTNIHLRVKNFGNESNPDSLRIEFAENSGFPGSRFFNTSTKWIDCDKCRATDKTPPTIQHCPTQIVKYPVTNHQYISEDGAAKLANITVSDNCELENVSTYPHRVYDVKKGQIIDFHTVAYDDAGNKSICQFKAQVVTAPCSAFPKPIIGYLPDMEALAAAGQTCKSVTWTPPSIYNESSFNPVKFTSNYPSGHCFPIGVTRVLYTAKDSCGKTDTAGFFVTVRKSNGTNIRVTADNQQVTLDIKTLSPNPTDGALLMNLKSLVAKEVTFDFYNTVGSKVYSQTQQVQKGENELFFDVTQLPTGVYFIQTSELGEQKAATKFVKN